MTPKPFSTLPPIHRNPPAHLCLGVGECTGPLVLELLHRTAQVQVGCPCGDLETWVLLTIRPCRVARVRAFVARAAEACFLLSTLDVVVSSIREAKRAMWCSVGSRPQPPEPRTPPQKLRELVCSSEGKVIAAARLGDRHRAPVSNRQEQDLC